jgi:hypothetical protein
MAFGQTVFGQMAFQSKNFDKVIPEPHIGIKKITMTTIKAQNLT